MAKRITAHETEQYTAMETLAKEIADKVDSFVVAILATEIPDKIKLRILDHVKKEHSFRSLAYLLHVQHEWVGGDSLDDKNHVATAPHIAFNP